MNWCRLPYDCKTYEDILTYAMNAEWPTDIKRPGSRKQFIPIPTELMKEPILGKLSKVCTEIAIMRLEPRSIFREHIDSKRFCSLTICLHESKSHTFILEPDVYLSDENSQKYLDRISKDSLTFPFGVTTATAVRDLKNPWKFIANNCALYEEPQYEPGGIYLLNTSRRHGVINYSYEPRYSGFFTISKDIIYEDAKELLGELVL
jgi:hypothetical protein